MSRKYDGSDSRRVGGGSTTSVVRALKRLLRGVASFVDEFRQADRAMVSGLGGTNRDTDDGHADTAIEELVYTREDWSYQRTVETRGELGVGDWVRFEKDLTEEDVRSFAMTSGDTNRLHLEEKFAKRTRFNGRIVHGTLLLGLVSAALARLPGLTIYLSQDFDFVNPGRIGERFVAVCEITEDLGDGKYRLVTHVYDQDDETLVEGKAVVLIDELPDADDT